MTAAWSSSKKVGVALTAILTFALGWLWYSGRLVPWLGALPGINRTRVEPQIGVFAPGGIHGIRWEEGRILFRDLDQGLETRLELGETQQTRLEEKRCAWSPLGKWLAQKAQGTVYVYRVKPFLALDQTFTLKRGEVSVVAFSPDERVLVAGHESGFVECWDLDTGKVLTKFGDFDDPIITAQFSPEGNALMLVEARGRVSVWDWRRGKSFWTLPVDRPSRVMATYGARDWDLWVLKNGDPKPENSILECWNPLQGAKTWESPVWGEFRGMTAIRDGRSLVLHSGGQATLLLDARRGTRTWFGSRLKGPLSVGVNREGTRILFRDSSGNFELHALPEAFSDPALSAPPRNTWLKTFYRWLPIPSTPLATPTQAWLPGTQGMSCIVLESSSSKAVHLPFPAHPKGGTWRNGMLSPDGARIALAGLGGGLWIGASFERGFDLEKDLKGLRSQIVAMAWAGPNLLIAADETGATACWDLDTGLHTELPKVHQGVIQSMAVSGDGHRLASVSEDGLVRVIEIPSGRSIWQGNAGSGGARMLALDDTGSQLAALQFHGTVTIWDLGSSKIDGFEEYRHGEEDSRSVEALWIGFLAGSDHVLVRWSNGLLQERKGGSEREGIKGVVALRPGSKVFLSSDRKQVFVWDEGELSRLTFDGYEEGKRIIIWQSPRSVEISEDGC